VSSRKTLTKRSSANEITQLPGHEAQLSPGECRVCCISRKVGQSRPAIMSLSSPFRPNALLAVSAPLLVLLTKAPPSVRARLLSHVPSSVDRGRLITTLLWLAAVGSVAQLNSLLNAWARNNWIWQNWGRGRGESLGAHGWDNEVAVITGGSSGIGNTYAARASFRLTFFRSCDSSWARGNGHQGGRPGHC
jgi:hypothetical protein